jgi:hypothetical protein
MSIGVNTAIDDYDAAMNVGSLRTAEEVNDGSGPPVPLAISRASANIVPFSALSCDCPIASDAKRSARNHVWMSTPAPTPLSGA